MKETQKAVDRRLARIEGQIRGLRRLVAEDAYCADLLHQIHAVRSALDQVAASVTASHIQNCVLNPTGEAAHPNARTLSQTELMEELSEVLRLLAR